MDALRQIGPADSSCVPLDAYFRGGTAGLKAYSRKFDVGRSELCAALRRNPPRYAAIEPKLGALDSVAAHVSALLTEFTAVNPEGRRPGVYFVVGDGISGGSTTLGRNPLILITTERTSRSDMLSPFSATSPT